MRYCLFLVILFLILETTTTAIIPDAIRLSFEYFSTTTSNSEDEDGYLTVPELIKKYGYPVEQYYVETPDHYILNLHRIPYGKTKKRLNKVAYLQHGLLASSADWVLCGPGKALADEGYDVWLGNARGNRYSRNHTSLDPNKDAKFWSFSWHEIGYYDIATIIDFILNTTKHTKLFHIGHSQGTTTFYVLNSMRPDYNRKIIAHFSLAPIAYMKHMTSPLIQLISRVERPLGALLDFIEMREFLPSTRMLNMAGNMFCFDGEITQVLCKNALFVLCGYSPNQLNSTMLPVLMGHTPAGSSTRQLLHYAQEVISGKFQRFNYGEEENRRIYGSSTPPSYDLAKVTAPIYLIYSLNDWLAAEVDVLRLFKELPNVVGKYLVADKEFNHLDYIYGISAKQQVYDLVVNTMSKLK